MAAYESPLNALMNALPQYAMQLYQSNQNEKSQDREMAFREKQLAATKEGADKEANYRDEMLKIAKEEQNFTNVLQELQAQRLRDEIKNSAWGQEIVSTDSVLGSGVADRFGLAKELPRSYLMDFQGSAGYAQYMAGKQSANLDMNNPEYAQFDLDNSGNVSQEELQKGMALMQFSQQMQMGKGNIEKLGLENELSRATNPNRIAFSDIQRESAGLTLDDQQLEKARKKLPGLMRNLDVSGLNLDDMYTKEDRFYGDSPSFLGQAWDSFRDVTNAVTEPFGGGTGIFGKDYDINLNNLNDVLSNESQEISDYLKPFNIPDELYSDAYTEAQKKRNTVISNAVEDNMFAIRKKYGDKKTKTLLEKLIENNLFIAAFKQARPGADIMQLGMEEMPQIQR